MRVQYKGESADVNIEEAEAVMIQMRKAGRSEEAVKKKILEMIKSKFLGQGLSEEAFEAFTSQLVKGKSPSVNHKGLNMKDGFLQVPLHITWMNETMTYLEKMVLSNRSLKPLFDEVMVAGTVKGRNPKNSAEADLIAGLNLVFSAKNAQEVVVKDRVEIFGVTSDWDLKSAFNPVFEDMIINLHFKNQGYLASFMQLFKLDENYTDPSSGEVSPVYIAKTMTKSNSASTSSVPLSYKAVFEAILIKSKLPRVLFPSYISDICRKCTMITESNMMTNIYGRANEGVRYCLKTPRNFHNCCLVNMEDPYPPNNNPTFAEIGFAHLKMMTDVLERLNKPPEHISKTSVESTKREYSFKEKNRFLNHDERSYIEIKSVVIDTVRPNASVHQGGSHASPVEHLRRGHERHYKSGKVVWVNKSIVNPGGKKPVYVVRENK